MTKELHTHCQCDNCTGEDCGQDNPEEYEREQAKELADIRQAERGKVLDELKRDLKTRFVSSSNPWSKGRNSGLLECCNIIDELRKQAGE
jgi:hypothetical protein